MNATNAARGDVVPATGDRNARLAEGTLIEASVVARLLGVKVLTLDASVMLLPAQPTRPAPVPTRTAGSRRASTAVARGSLADALRCLREGAAILDETRRNGTS